ncbi:MAG: urease accessory UreF family protein [Myxococcota bacterium]
MNDVLAIARLLRLASPALPIGAYAWSGGLEGAIDEGVVRDAASAGAWLDDALTLVQARWDAAIVWRLLTRPEARAAWNERYLASRETRELRAETLQIGQALTGLLGSLGHAIEATAATGASGSITFPCAWALAADAWRIAPEPALAAWLTAFVEGQLAVLMKALPLGQVAAQRLFDALLPTLGMAAEVARSIADEDLSSSTPGLAIASARHEHQYSRLFRS